MIKIKSPSMQVAAGTNFSGLKEAVVALSPLYPPRAAALVFGNSAFPWPFKNTEWMTLHNLTTFIDGSLQPPPRLGSKARPPRIPLRLQKRRGPRDSKLKQWREGKVLCSFYANFCSSSKNCTSVKFQVHPPSTAAAFPDSWIMNALSGFQDSGRKGEDTYLDLAAVFLSYLSSNPGFLFDVRSCAYPGPPGCAVEV